MNPRKNMVMKQLWVKLEEYKQLTEALSEGRNDDVLDLIYKIYNRGDL